ncbi:MAG: hypothetical protein K0R50_2127 [Eubacterium sp.]|jgi:hypothetical protein|nr:hypothetical protein [Eubacterium sp.]
MYTIRRIFNPEIYQGKHKRNNYFEGWYYKIIDRNSENILAIIPGVAINNANKHSFIQFIDAKTGFTSFITYPIGEFSYSETELNIRIDKSRFTGRIMQICLQSPNLRVDGTVEFANSVTFPKSLINPGIMGPYSFIPFMECHHGIINIHSELKGGIHYNGKYIDFTDGYGYLEKDWGKSFPHSWIWLQSNNFSHSNTSIMFSIASIPWFHREFDGLISFLKLDDTFLRFATYTGARIKELKVNDQALAVMIQDSKYKLYIEAEYSKGGILKAPKKGIMEVDITESITSVVKVRLCEKSGKVLYDGVGENTGLELAGNYKKFVI